jgi:hypothetical protein
MYYRRQMMWHVAKHRFVTDAKQLRQGSHRQSPIIHNTFFNYYDFLNNIVLQKSHYFVILADIFGKAGELYMSA